MAPVSSPANSNFNRPSSSQGTKPSPAGVQGGAPAAPPQPAPSATPGPANCHLADSFQTDNLRTQILKQAENNPSVYGALAGGVDNMLKAMHVGISACSFDTVMDNIAQVKAGKMSQSTAHFNEAGTFAQDAFQSFANGKYGQGAVEAIGVGLNSVMGVGVLGVEAVSSVLRDPVAAVKAPGEALANGANYVAKESVNIEMWLRSMARPKP
ncbi:hypothetical protein SAMN05444354_12278 [Stigmatella aurantiaca]|uniref:Uncharacterized protein n=1 Tax=Stigmatella aurantiaca TaxID=41 RepID=A0A1H8AYE7_STIAU|nr:hypothetical protein [Stigmatella aurantiaca]SEM74934.1 hypothetical protein SAMN05444354_12278 [Stigmatella aurantiaca]